MQIEEKKKSRWARFGQHNVWQLLLAGCVCVCVCVFFFLRSTIFWDGLQGNQREATDVSGFPVVEPLPARAACIKGEFFESRAASD